MTRRRRRRRPKGKDTPAAEYRKPSFVLKHFRPELTMPELLDEIEQHPADWDTVVDRDTFQMLVNVVPLRQQAA
ncbi:hypothetical protein SUDANB148_02967 [Streptomyces sp. SudanB148_2056]|uniref:hypothetical protein n=1 Tax=Streptomyces sp. SudanB148_2056 TaxID=3035280 RepID=UPI003F558FD3